jgi:hypothetical protein
VISSIKTFWLVSGSITDRDITDNPAFSPFLSQLFHHLSRLWAGDLSPLGRRSLALGRRAGAWCGVGRRGDWYSVVKGFRGVDRRGDWYSVVKFFRARRGDGSLVLIFLSFYSVLDLYATANLKIFGRAPD